MTTAPIGTDIARRPATVMFVDIVGATTLSDRVGIERAYAIVTGCLRILDAIARRHGAVVDKYLSDCLMAVFGFPIQSADAGLAAVTAGVEMLEAAERYREQVDSPVPLALRIGINTGLMIAGDLRGPVVREFAVMGDAVNVAARLKDFGTVGNIHIGPETYENARAQFAFDTLEPLTLRGKLQRVPAFRVIPPAPGTRRKGSGTPTLVETPLLGRDAELTALRDGLAAAQAGHGQAILLDGEEGAGKSRLVTEIVREATAAGVAVIASRAVAAHRNAPLHVVADLLADARGSEPDDTLHGDALAAAIDDAITSALSRGPLLIACEDLQWADAASLEWLGRLARQLTDHAVLCVFTARPTEDAHAARTTDAVRRLALPPLGPDDAARLVDHVTGGVHLSPVARDRIERRAAGNPYRLILGALLAGAVETEVAQEAAGVERASEAERRRVTVLFSDITGFTRMSEQLPPAEAYRAVSGCLRVLHDVASKHGGSVDKYLGDCIMAVFGAPIAIEDSPRAAINAAIEMRRRVREYNVTAALPSPLDIHVGINTGLSVAGDISGPLLREFTLMGDAVSIASKLKDVAPAGQIWVGTDTHRETRAHFEYEAVPSSPDAPQPGGAAWAVRSEREQVYRARVGRGETIFTELVGRDEELRTLRAALAGLADGRGGAAGLIGDAGLGKSRLIAELTAAPEARNVRWVEGRSVAMGRTLRFHPFVDLLRSMFDLGEDTAAGTFAQLHDVLAPVLGDESDELVPLLAMLLGVDLPPETAERIAEIRSDVIDKLQLHAMRALLLGVARERPLALFFEDLYWADRSSIELLGELLRLGLDAPILFFFTARPGFPETTGRIVDVMRATLPPEQTVLLELQPLTAAEVAKLLGTLFPHGALPRASRERLAEHAGGNPLYVEELLRSLIEQGAVEVTANGLRATAAIASIVVPTTVQEVILTRVDRLPPRPKQVLQLAAVVGQRVAQPVLSALATNTASLAETLDQTLDELVDAQLLLRDDRGEVPHYTFKHRLIQDVTYESMLEGRRADLHRDVGHVIEEHLRGAPGFHGMLAYHYSMGNDLERAEEQLFLAGDDAARAGAPVEALELLQESSRLYFARNPEGGDPTKRVALYKRLAGAHLHRGQMEEATRNYDAALSVLGEVAPAGQLAIGLRLSRTLGAVALDLYLLNGGSARRPGATAEDLEVIDLMFNRARAQTTADPARFVLNGLETLRRLRRIDPSTVPGAGAMYAGTVGLFSFGGISFAVAQRFLAVGERYVDRDSVPEVFFWHIMSFAHHFISGDWDDRHEIPMTLVEDALRQGQLWDVATHVGLESFKQLAQGRWGETTAHVDLLERVEETYAYDLARSNRHAALAFLHTERRVLDAAQAAADVYLTSHDEALLNLLALGTKAKVQVLRGDFAGARATLAVAAPMCAQRLPPWHFGVVVRSRLLLDAAERDASADTAVRTRAITRADRRDALWCAARFAWLRPEVWHTIGDLEWLRGKRRAAIGWFGRALDEAERLRMRPDAARIRLGIARRLLEGEPGSGATTFRGQDAATLLDVARHEFVALDLAWDLAQLDAVVARVPGSGAAVAAH